MLVYQRVNLAKPNQGKRHGKIGKIHAPVASYPSITDRPQRILFRGTWSIHSALDESLVLHFLKPVFCIDRQP